MINILGIIFAIPVLLHRLEFKKAKQNAHYKMATDNEVGHPLYVEL